MKKFEQYFKFCKDGNLNPSHADSLIKFFNKERLWIKQQKQY